MKGTVVSSKEHIILQVLRDAGYKWVARDINGQFCAFYLEPYLNGTKWKSDPVFCDDDYRADITTDDEDFRYVTWRDDPRMITDLLDETGYADTCTKQQREETLSAKNNKECIILQVLKDIGYEWIARDLNGQFCAFFHQPYRKGTDTWETEIVFFNNDQRANITTEEDDFRFVTWEGDPLLITDLIYD